MLESSEKDLKEMILWSFEKVLWRLGRFGWQWFLMMDLLRLDMTGYVVNVKLRHYKYHLTRFMLKVNTEVNSSSLNLCLCVSVFLA